MQFMPMPGMFADTKMCEHMYEILCVLDALAVNMTYAQSSLIAYIVDRRCLASFKFFHIHSVMFHDRHGKPGVLKIHWFRSQFL